MALLPKVKLKALVSFPATVLDGVGIDVAKNNGTYQFNLDFGDFAPPVSGVVDPTHQNVLLWNSNTQVYTLTPISLFGGGGGIPDAPNDGVQYGRQSLAWTPVVSGGSPSNANPVMDGVAAPGVATAYSRGDHVHPTDTTRAAVSALPVPATAVPLVESGSGTVGVSVKYAREDHVHPAGGGGGGGASVLVSDTPPVGAADNSLWWESDTGSLYIRYNDGNSVQWVAIGVSSLSDAPSDGGLYVRQNGAWVNIGAAWTPYTPVCTSSIGTITTVSAAGRYLQVGKTVHISVTITVTTAGSGAGVLFVPLPVNARSGVAQSLAGSETAALGVAAQAAITTGNNTRVSVVKYDATTLIVNSAVIAISGVYEAA